MKQLIFTAIFFSIALLPVFGQSPDDDLSEVIKGELSYEQVRTVEKAEQLIEEAKRYEAEADNMYQDVNKLQMSAKIETRRGKQRRLERRANRLVNKAVKKLFDAGEKYEVANDMTFDVYRQKALEIRPDANENDELLRAGRMYENLAAETFRDAKALRRRLSRNRNQHADIRKSFQEVHDMEAQGLQYQLNAIGIYFKWFSPDDLMPADSTEQMTDNETLEITEDTISVAHNIVYKVQILAVSEPASNETLEEIYTGSEVVEEQYDSYQKLYKYLIGHLDTYKEAKAMQESLDIPDAFVIAQKNGVRIDLGQAVQITDPDVEIDEDDIGN